jgi:hypothetical protein
LIVFIVLKPVDKRGEKAEGRGQRRWGRDIKMTKIETICAPPPPAQTQPLDAMAVGATDEGKAKHRVAHFDVSCCNVLSDGVSFEWMGLRGGGGTCKGR